MSIEILKDDYFYYVRYSDRDIENLLSMLEIDKERDICEDYYHGKLIDLVKGLKPYKDTTIVLWKRGINKVSFIESSNYLESDEFKSDIKLAMSRYEECL